ncbi:MAG: hypothetical protein RR273_06420 [Oscillospiraceae bacterium]
MPFVVRGYRVVIYINILSYGWDKIKLPLEKRGVDGGFFIVQAKGGLCDKAATKLRKSGENFIKICGMIVPVLIGTGGGDKVSAFFVPQKGGEG